MLELQGQILGMVIPGPAEVYELRSDRLSYTNSSLRILTTNRLVLMALLRIWVIRDLVETTIYQNLLVKRQSQLWKTFSFENSNYKRLAYLHNVLFLSAYSCIIML
jgi:hypothetical protein